MKTRVESSVGGFFCIQIRRVLYLVDNPPYIGGQASGRGARQRARHTDMKRRKEHTGCSFGFRISGLLLTVAVMSGWVPVQAASLPQVVRTALDNHPRVKSALAEERAAGHDLREARAGYFPSLSLDAGIGREHTDIDSFAQGGGDADKTLTRRELGLSLSYNLYDGEGTRSAVARRTALLGASRERRDLSREDIAALAVEAYLDVRKWRKLEALARSNVAAHQETYDKVRRGVEQGVGERANLQQARARLALARSTLVAREGRLREAVNDYVQVVGEAPGVLEDPPSPQTTLVEAGSVNLEALEDSVREATAVALDTNPAVTAARLEVEAAQAATREARSAYLPRVDLQFTAVRDDDIGGVEGNRQEEALMVVARWEAYQGGANRARERALAERRIATAEALANTHRDVTNRVANALQALATSAARMEYLREHVAASRETLTAYQAQFELGRRTLLDVLNAENELFTARSNLTSEFYNELLSQYLVESAKGLLVSSLGLND